MTRPATQNDAKHTDVTWVTRLTPNTATLTFPTHGHVSDGLQSPSVAPMDAKKIALSPPFLPLLNAAPRCLRHHKTVFGRATVPGIAPSFQRTLWNCAVMHAWTTEGLAAGNGGGGGGEAFAWCVLTLSLFCDVSITTVPAGAFCVVPPS